MKDHIWEFVYWWKTVLLFEYDILQMLSIAVQTSALSLKAEFKSATIVKV